MSRCGNLRKLAIGRRKSHSPANFVRSIDGGTQARPDFAAYACALVRSGKLICIARRSAAEKAGFEFDQKILVVRAPNDQPAKEWLWIPALIVLVLLALLQRRRRVAELASASA